MNKRRYFAVGTRPPRLPSSRTIKLAAAVAWLVERKKADGTWGGPDSLDQLICTTHATMTIMAAGIQPNSELIRPSLDYLADIDINRLTTFFWRSGPLLNVEGFEGTVDHDIAHLLRLRERAGGNPNYPAPFFLLKLLRFREEEENASELKYLVDWLISEWDKDKCWYGLTSISSMGLALLADRNDVPKRIIDRTKEFLVAAFKPQEDGRVGFSSNLIDDSFTVYNLYERFDILEPIVGSELYTLLDECMDGILPLDTDGIWNCQPPFGGSVEGPEYATAVVIRAAIARELAHNNEFERNLALAISEERLTYHASVAVSQTDIVPFWGPLRISKEPFCFVAMPFEERRTDIYKNYIKEPIERETPLSCKRVDDMIRSRQIMDDVWKMTLSCSVVIADLSEQNPNVFYELGLAHVVGKPVILISETLDDIPFDLKHIRTIIYGNSPTSWDNLAQTVVEYVMSELNI